MAIIFVCAVCLAASTIGGICGVGGGVVIKPLLDVTGIMSVSTLSFLSGLTVLAMACINVWKSRKSKELETRRSIPLGLGAAVGGVSGKYLFDLIRKSLGNDRLVGGIQAIVLGILVLGTLLYVLNKKREDLHKIEMAYNVRIFLETDDSLLFPTDYRIERVVRVEADSITDPGSEEENEIAEEQEETPVVQAVKQPRERRRRRNRRDQKEHKNADTESVKNVQAESTVESEEEIIQADEMFEEGLKSSQKAEEQTEEPQEKSKEMKHHRRGRFLRRNKRFHKNKASAEASENSFEETNASDQQVAQENEEKPVRKPRRRYNRRRHNTPAPAETAE